MAVFAVGSAAIVVFALMFVVLRLVPVCQKAIDLARDAAAVLRSQTLTDDEKEAKIQKASLRLMGSFGQILLRSILLLLASGVPIWIADITGWVPAEAAIDWLSRLDVILIASIVMIGLYFLFRRKRA